MHPETIVSADPGNTFDWGAIGSAVVHDASVLVTYFPLAIAGTIVWGLWLYRFILSHRAPAIVTDFRTSTSVIVP